MEGKGKVGRGDPLHTAYARAEGRGALTACEPPETDRALAVCTCEELVVDESGQERAAFWRRGAFGGEELGEELHVV